MNKIKNIIVALGVFTMMIVSGFAMDTNPPTEPVKVVIETEVVEEAPQQVLMGYGYKDGSGNCVFHSAVPPQNCSIMNNGDICTIEIDEILYPMYFMTRPSTSSPWICVLPLRKPL
ncbi:hypothetical protein [Myroides guanonis]|uniref:Uncharacterized protein n=1 Tax=Myroides guanonis TaxID=1150112 RepID=A0A1I3R007_9FLAO|nr:hypothetical protein [Myroides guanonis]SFJ39668.1 hypothetical protein SAMN04487893_1076 [Myroides guanonis]